MHATDLHALPSADFETKRAESAALLRHACAEFSPIAQASSLGAEDMVVTDLLHQAGLAASTSIFVLDTGKLHDETLALVSRIEAHYGVAVARYRPEADVATAFETRDGADAMFRSIDLRKACCAIRKLEPLSRALAGQRGWITGLRREQSMARAAVELIDVEAERTKFNPLAHWTNGDVWHYIATRDVPYNPLHDRFFPSIGCAPCTRAVTLGEDPRSGRWWWEQAGARECGLHVVGASVIPVREAA